MCCYTQMRGPSYNLKTPPILKIKIWSFLDNSSEEIMVGLEGTIELSRLVVVGKLRY